MLHVSCPSGEERSATCQSVSRGGSGGWRDRGASGEELATSCQSDSEAGGWRDRGASGQERGTCCHFLRRGRSKGLRDPGALVKCQKQCKITIQHIRSKTVFGFACVACLGSRRDRANDSPLFFLGHDIFVVVDIDVLSLFINVPHF